MNVYDFFFEKTHVKFISKISPPTSTERKAINLYLNLLCSGLIYCSYSDFDQSEDFDFTLDSISFVYLDLLQYIARSFEDNENLELFLLNYSF